LQGPFSDDATGANAYLLILPSGGRVELRQTTDGSYVSVDSSNIQLLTGGYGQALVRTPDGTQFTYVTVNGALRCTSIKDRNGNYITAAYNSIGRLTSLTDTLGRVITYNYDTNNRLQSISQMRGNTQHLWATFGYGMLTVQPNFQETDGTPITVQGPNNTAITVLTQVGLDDGSYFTFDYTLWGQVATITHHAADTHVLAYSTYNLPTTSIAQSDCPRFTERRDYAENWNNGAQAVTKYFSGTDTNGSWVGMSRPDAPDVVAHKEYDSIDASDWKRGLLVRAEEYDPNNTSIIQKVTTIDWTQDDPGAAYLMNPRPTQTTITDSAGNTRLTAFNYTSFGLVSDIYELGGNPLVFYRRTHIDYNLNPAYLSQHIIGLVQGQYVFGPENNSQQLYSKAIYQYDEGTLALPGGKVVSVTPTQHDASYDASFLQRGNQTSAWHFDASDEQTTAKALVSHAGYDIAGSLVSATDAAGHQTSIQYGDAFVLGSSFQSPDVASAAPSDDAAAIKGGTTQTVAYPTSVTDADSNTSFIKYDFYTGLKVRMQGPPPQGASEGAIQATVYDSAGRVKQTNTFLTSSAEAGNNAYRYTRMVYPASQIIINTFATIQDNAGEAYSATVFDGTGQVRAAASDFPGSTGHYRGQYTLYDNLGQTIRQYRPTEMTSTWSATGDDAAGWYYTQQTYDWKGRPTKTASYGGCGCAGGEVMTLTDEVGRQQIVSHDPMGRVVSAQVLNMDAQHSVYQTTTSTYNALDQVTQTRVYQGGGDERRLSTGDV